MPTEVLLIFSILAWIITALMTAFLAAELGRSSIWLLLGLLLGPIALIAVGFFGRAEGLVFRRCPYCLELAAQRATICPHCRTALPPATPLQPGP